MVTLLAHWVHRIFPVIKFGSHFWKTRRIKVVSPEQNDPMQLLKWRFLNFYFSFPKMDGVALWENSFIYKLSLYQFSFRAGQIYETQMNFISLLKDVGISKHFHKRPIFIWQNGAAKMKPNKKTKTFKGRGIWVFTAASEKPDIYCKMGTTNKIQTLQKPLLTWISENLFSLSDVYKLLLCLLLFFWVLEVVWVPLLGQFPVGFDDLLLLSGSVAVRRILSAHLPKMKAFHSSYLTFQI